MNPPTETNQPTESSQPSPIAADTLASRGVRGAVGGTLMGLANLVPGLSGGTMLLASGIYPEFVAAVAEVTTLRFRRRSLVVLGAVGIFAALAISLGAGVLKDLVVGRRWVMYSLFIGWTLGGVPLVWRLARPVRLRVRSGEDGCGAAGLAIGAAAGLLAMIAMAAYSPAGASSAETGAPWWLLALAGVAAAAAMVLPGISGSYLLLIMGLYVPVLGAIDALKDAASAGDVGAMAAPLRVVVPVGVGAAIGLVGMSNLVRWLLVHQRGATLGALLGLLVGATIGLYPFQGEGHSASAARVGMALALAIAAGASTLALDRWASRGASRANP